jgi:glycosyltransferase involved in cell wall biosynthesis
MTAERIAYVLGATAGGTGRHVAMLAAGCAGRGLTVSTFGPAAAGPLLAPGSSFAPVEIADRPRPGHDLAAILRLRGLLAAARPDVVHAHGLRAGAAAAAAIALLLPVRRGSASRGSARRGPASRGPASRGPASRGPALLVTVHNAPPDGALAAAVYRALELVVARRATAVLAVSPDLAARMRRRGAADVGPAIVPAPVMARPSAAQIEQAVADIGADGAPVVLAVGRLAAQKGFSVLLDAAASWQDRRPRPLLALAGAGPLAGPLAVRARGQGLAVRFLGQRDDVPALLQAADVVVVPSRWEGQPLIVQEAMRAGRPLVASRAGGIPGLTGEDAALLVAPLDPGQLAAAVLAVIGDRALARRLGAAALARAAAFPSESDAVNAVIAVYDRLVVPRGRPAMDG